MEFLPSSTLAPPKNLYPCLATISLGAPQLGRRGSGSLKGPKAEDEDGNPLMRAISGNRRRTSFGVAAERTSGEERRKSLSADGVGGATGTGSGAGTGTGTGQADEGTWYWRVRAGATDTHIVLLPLSEPANTLLTTPPGPLSHALPAHSKQHNATSAEAKAEEGSGVIGKVKSLFNRRASKVDEHHASGGGGSGGETGTGAGSAVLEQPADQTADGALRPTGSAMAMGATNLNGSAEIGWPGVVQGQPLGAVLVGLGSVRAEDIKVGGGKKGEASWVTVPVHAAGGLPGVGAHLSDQPRSGTIKFEFDKEWIGAKAEAELLHHHIVNALESGGSNFGHLSGGHRQAQPTSVQLGH